ncbi:MAG: hypothetical protein QOH46_1210, partial [Solirubrobacteraceae bacterium]|nr:hypothetical protein [Solirubrobacteraceae bacterium]
MDRRVAASGGRPHLAERVARHRAGPVVRVQQQTAKDGVTGDDKPPVGPQQPFIVCDLPLTQREGQSQPFVQLADESAELRAERGEKRVDAPPTVLHRNPFAFER